MNARSEVAPSPPVPWWLWEQAATNVKANTVSNNCGKRGMMRPPLPQQPTASRVSDLQSGDGDGEEGVEATDVGFECGLLIVGHRLAQGLVAGEGVEDGVGGGCQLIVEVGGEGVAGVAAL